MRLRSLIAPLLLLSASLACTSLLGDDFSVVAGAGGTGGTGGSGGALSGECSERHVDCDGNPANGCEVDLDTDLDHCGSCTAACEYPQGVAICSRGNCALAACSSGFGNCDGEAANGCETPLNSAAHCGACGRACVNPNGGTTCAAGACVPQCAQGFANCDDNTANGCETNTDSSLAHCGGCGAPCGAQDTCFMGQCVPAAQCGNFKADCDGNGSGTDANGCETNIAADSAHCGGCGAACPEVQYCLGECTACPANTLDCNKGVDGCEVMETALDCGACGQRCGEDATCGCSSNTCSGGTVFFSENFSSNARAWSLQGEWEIGATSVGPALEATFEEGFQNPEFDVTPTADNGVAGTVLGGNYDYMRVHPAEYLTSPVIALPDNAAQVWLTFRSWLNGDGRDWTRFTVEVFNGSSWVVLWENRRDLTASSAWSRSEFDVTAYKNPAFRVRFGFLLRIHQQLYPWRMSGWNIDDVTLSSDTCL